MKIYVAGGWFLRNEIKLINEKISSIPDVEVISGWIERENGINTPEALQSDADNDIKEVSEADCLLAIMSDAKYPYRGTFTEIGCALGQKKPVIIVCPGTGCEKVPGQKWEYDFYCMTNVFFHHSLIEHAASIDEAINLIDKITKKNL